MKSATGLWTAADAAAATGGRTAGDWIANGASIDSRSLEPGNLFVALKGPNHDGHDYVAQALKAGAAAAMVERPLGDSGDRGSLLIVPDTMEALTRLGVAARARSAARIVAVTGSVGKTTTKEVLAAALGGQAPTHASAKSFNNAIGVALSLARLPQEAAYGVFEIGMNHAGEIAPLTRLVSPHVCIITTIEAVHVENFDNGLDGIAQAKAEIFMGCLGGVAVLNRDNDYFDFLAGQARAAGLSRVIGFGARPEAEVRLIDARLGPSASTVQVQLGGRALTYRIGTPGRHWVMNSLAVLAAVDALGAEVGAAAGALAQLTPLQGRGRRHRLTWGKGEIELIDDSYNASPVSMRAAFEVLAASEIGTGGRRVVVLGDMLELGREAPRLHAELAAALVAAGVDLVFTCGPLMRHLHEALPAQLRAAHAADAASVVPLVLAALGPGDVVVVKGSYGSRMGRVVEALRGFETKRQGRAAAWVPPSLFAVI